MDVESTRKAVRVLYADLSELDHDEFLARARHLLYDTTAASLLVAIFLEFQSSLSYAMLVNLSPLFESLEYEDIITAMREISTSNLSAYHFSLYVPEVFGIDIIQTARKTQEKYPQERTRLAVFADLKKLIGPSKHTQEMLVEAGASPESIRENLQRTGAPLLPLPE